jgi:putative endonuclease
MNSRDVHSKKITKREGKFFVYIVQCRDGTYYTGHTKDLKNRIASHNSGYGAKYLKRKLPIKLVYSKEYRYYKNALRGERSIKKLTRKQKEKLIGIYANNNHDIKK